MNFSKFFFRFLSTRDGFLSLPKEDLAASPPGTCVFTLVFVPFDPFIVGRKVPFLCLYSALSSLHKGLYIKAMLGVNFRRFVFPVSFALRMDF